MNVSAFGLMAEWTLAGHRFIFAVTLPFLILVVSAFLANVQMRFQGWVRSGWEGKGVYLSYKYVAAF